MENITTTFNNGPRVEIRGVSKNDYHVKFVNNETDQIIFQDTIASNHYSKAHAEYHVPWKVEVKVKDQIVKEEILNLSGQIVKISFESSALGDSVCWVPYVEEFRKSHNCVVYCSTFHNHLYEKEYPKIHFVNRRQQQAPSARATYKIGWFGRGQKSNKNPIDCRTIPLQQLPCSILNIPYEEIRPKVTKDKRAPLYNHENYVAISTSSTAQAKYWNHPSGWQSLVDWLNGRGFKVVNIGREKNKLRNVIDMTGAKPIYDIVNVIQHSKFFIGISSGLTWLSWALHKKAVMISGFTAPWFEYQEESYRVHNDKVCHSCFTNPRHGFNRGDWMWCPVHKNTPRQFECTKKITVDMVQEKVIQLEEDLKNHV